MQPSFILVAAPSLALLIACGASSELVGAAPSGEGGDASTSSIATTSMTGTGDVGSSASVGGSSGVGGASSATSSSSSSSSSGGPPDPLVCGAAGCDPAAEECCVTQGGLVCLPIGQCYGIVLLCKSAANCAAGDLCCVDSKPGMGSEAHCAYYSCGDDPYEQFCASDAECPAGFICKGAFGTGDLKSCAP